MDITSRDWRRILTIQNDTLTQVVSQRSLKAILNDLTNSLDSLGAEHAVTILLNTKHGLRPIAGSRIPKEWRVLIDPLPLGKNVGSCGTAGYFKKRIIVSNLMKSPLWKDYRVHQSKHGFMACWSQPIIEVNTNKLLGTFAIYFKNPRKPSPFEVELIKSLAITVGVVIERRQHDKILNRINHKLDKKVKIRTEALIKAKEKAMESDRLKTAFLANISHEIRTPMNGILGFAELLLEAELDGESQKKYINIIRKSSNRMLKIINNVISISKIEAGATELAITSFSINSVMEDIYTFYKYKVEKRGIEFELRDSIPERLSFINSDKEKLTSVLSNLVQNAIKYTSVGSIKMICVRNESYFEFRIEDTGIGIKSERQEAIFDRFVQADILDKDAYQGAGLGLSISKAYVNFLGGDIGVNSKEGQGSIFYFNIPIEYFEKEREELQINELVDGKSKDWKTKLKILIADDDYPSYYYLSLLLKGKCREVLYAQTGSEAVQLCKTIPDIDVILMDIKMPDVNGYEAAESIRRFNSKVRIIGQTAYGYDEDKEKAKNADFDDYISKPIRKESLFSLIRRTMQVY
nr:ATP-binding protein [uncultured Draconibacterium sp.]